MWLLQSVVTLFLLLGAVNGANILCYFTAPSLSHQITFHPIIRELANRGHNLTVITPNPMRDANLTNVDEIDVEEISYYSWNKYNISSFGVNEEVASTDLTPIINAYMEIVDSQLSHPRVKALINGSKSNHFDIFITEHPHYFTTPFKRIYGTGMVGIGSLPLHMGSNGMIGNFEHSSLFPDLNLPYSNKLTFWQKIHSYIHSTIGVTMMRRIKPRLFEILTPHFGAELVNEIDVLSKEYDLVMVNYNPILHAPRPNVPAVIEFNGIHIKPPKPLPEVYIGYNCF